MTTQQITHEVGVLIVGAAAIYATEQSPLDGPLKNVVRLALCIATAAWMAKIAGVL